MPRSLTPDAQDLTFNPVTKMTEYLREHGWVQYIRANRDGQVCIAGAYEVGVMEEVKYSDDYSLADKELLERKKFSWCGVYHVLQTVIRNYRPDNRYVTVEDFNDDTNTTEEDVFNVLELAEKEWYARYR